MKLKLYYFSIALLCILFTNLDGFAQGCVAVRNMSSCALEFDSAASSAWQFSLNYRYFRSFRHFRGTHEEKNRVEDGNEVINNDNSVLLGISYTINRRWSVSATVPLIYIDRSSLYEHNRAERYHTSSQGLGDVRITGYYTVLPHSHKTQLLVGLGVKLPTGNYNYKDEFHKADGIQTLPVDQSIQPGDGGTGIITEFDFLQKLNSKFAIYSTGVYLFNPRNTNGTLRSPNPTDGIPLSNEMSVCDQFQVRLGARYSLSNFQFALGGRYEGIPSEDIFGDSDGFRRPGRILSVEPSINYVTGKHFIGVNVPIALYRNRTQNDIDKKRTEMSGTFTQGDAAFADWLLSVTYAFRFTK